MKQATEVTRLPISKADMILASAIHAALMHDLNLHRTIKISPYETRANHLALGVVICDACGKWCSIDYKWCSNCREEVVIYTRELIKKQAASARWKKNKEKK